MSIDARFLPWAILGLGLGAMYVPVIHGLLNGLWSTDQNAHGPIVLAVAGWFFFFKGRQIYQERGFSFAPAPVGGSVVFLLGIAAYVVGHSQEFHLLEILSLNLVVLGGTLITFGWQVVKRLWFAFFFLLFVIPLPGSVIDALTQPMKVAVSWAAEGLLYGMGYPVSRSGVVIGIGAYQLLVADACAGLNSLFSLEAMGLLYINVVGHAAPWRNAVLAVLIVPISFACNVARVVLLSLITFHWGDDAGQGFLHVSSGLALFVVGLVFIYCVDWFLTFLVKLAAQGQIAAAPPNSTQGRA